MQQFRKDIIRHLVVFLKSSSIYGVAGIFGKSAQVVVAILLIRNMTISDYGILDFLLILSNLLVVLFTFGQDSSTGRYFFEYPDPSNRQQLISQSLFFQLLTLSIGLPAVWMIAKLLATSSAYIDAYDLLVPFFLIQVPFLLLIDFSLNILNWSRRPRAYCVLMIGSSFSQLISVLILLSISTPNIKTALFAYLASNATSAFVGLFLIRSWLVWPKNFEKVKLTLSYAAPVGVISLAVAVMPAVERALVDNYLSKQSLGEYAIAAKILLIPLFFYTIFSTVWTPFYLSVYKNSNAQDIYNLLLKILCVIGGLIFVVVNSIADFFIELLADARYPGTSIILFFLGFGILIRNIGYILEIGIDLSGRTYLRLINYVCETLATICLSVLLAPYFGLYGVGTAVLVGRALNLLLVVLTGRFVYPLRWEISFVIFFAGMVFVINALVLVAKHYEYFFLAIGTELISVFCIIYLFLRSLSNSDREFLAWGYRYLRRGI